MMHRSLMPCNICSTLIPLETFIANYFWLLSFSWSDTFYCNQPCIKCWTIQRISLCASWTQVHNHVVSSPHESSFIKKYIYLYSCLNGNSSFVPQWCKQQWAETLETIRPQSMWSSCTVDTKKSGKNPLSCLFPLIYTCTIVRPN